MGEALQNATQLFTFQISEEKKIEALYLNATKQEQNNLRFPELLMILLEKGLVRNGHGLKFYLENYQRILDEEIKEEKKGVEITTDLRQMKKMQDATKESAVGKMSKFKFEYFIKTVGKLYFHGQKNPIEKFLEQLLLEQQVSRKRSAQNNHPQHRVFNYDESNKKILNEQVLEAILEFEEDFKLLFTGFIAENYDKQQIMLSWDELDMLNKKMTTMSMLRMLVDSNIIPTLITPESYADIQIRLVPPYNSIEQHFYSGESIKKITEKDLGKKSITTRYDGDPCISFFEFQIILARLAVDHTPKDQIKKDRDLYEAIAKFFNQVVGLRPKHQQGDWDFLKKQNRYSSLYLHRLFSPQQSQLQAHSKKSKESVAEDSQMKKDSTQQMGNGQQKNQIDDNEEEFFDQPLKLLQAIENNAKFGEGLASKFDLDAIYKVLVAELPPLPQIYQVFFSKHLEDKTYFQCLFKPTKQVTDVTKYVPKVIGEQPPKPPVDKNQKKQEKGDPKKKGKKEDERPIIFEPPKPPLPTSYDNIAKHNDELEFNNPYQIHQKSGVMSHIEAAPIILEEMIYPQNIPFDSKRLLEAALLNFAQQNFASALENVNSCYENWLNLEDRSDLTIQNEIFFEYFKGTIFQSAGRDDLALSSFFSAKFLSDKLGMDCPDKALPFCGLGGILFRMEEYQLSLRSFLKAREIREQSIGADNIESATVYNNLGCCMLKLNRNLEASSYFEISQAIFDLELGQFHIRTSTVSRNLIKAKKQGLSFLPEFKIPWVAYELDPFKKIKAKKKKKK